AHVRHRVGQWHQSDETHVRRTRNRMLRMRHEFAAGLVKIDLLRAECEGGAALPESDDGHAEDALVERATRLDAGHCQHEMVEPIDAYHADPLRISAWRSPCCYAGPGRSPPTRRTARTGSSAGARTTRG